MMAAITQAGRSAARGALREVTQFVRFIPIWLRNFQRRIPVVGGALATPVVGSFTFGTILLLGYGAYRMVM